MGLVKALMCVFFCSSCFFHIASVLKGFLHGCMPVAVTLSIAHFKKVTSELEFHLLLGVPFLREGRSGKAA